MEYQYLPAHFNHACVPGWEKTIVPLLGGEFRLICSCSTATSSHMPASLNHWVREGSTDTELGCIWTDCPLKYDISLCRCIDCLCNSSNDTPTQVTKKTTTKKNWITECVLLRRIKKMEVCTVEQREKGETEMEGGREWRWMERHWITGEGQAGFTTGCHGSSIILGSLPWEKLLEEGQRLKSVCVCMCYKTLFKHLHPYYQLSLHQHLHSTGELSRDSPTWGVCVQYVCVRVHSVWTQPYSDVNTCLPSMLNHKRNKQVDKSNGAVGQFARRR